MTALKGGNTSITATLTALNGVTLPQPLVVKIPVRVASVVSDSTGVTSSVIVDQLKPVANLQPGVPSGPYVIANIDTGDVLTGTFGGVCYNSKVGLALSECRDTSHLWYYDGEHLLYGSSTGTNNYLVFDSDHVTLGTLDNAVVFDQITQVSDKQAYNISASNYPYYINQYGGSNYKGVYIYFSSSSITLEAQFGLVLNWASIAQSGRRPPVIEVIHILV